MTVKGTDQELIGNKYLSIVRTGIIDFNESNFVGRRNPAIVLQNENTIPYFYFRTKVGNYQRDGPMTVDINQGGAPNYYPNSFMGPVDSFKWKQSPIQVGAIQST